MMTRFGVGVGVCGLVIGWTAANPAELRAQSAGGPPRVSVGVGGGVAVPFHGDFDFNAWAWDADVRFALSRHTLLEVSGGDWRHTETSVLTDVVVQTPPLPAGSFGRLEQSTVRVQRAVHASLLGTGSVGRVRLSGGGGVGLLGHNRRFRQTTEGCSGSLVDACGTLENTFSSISTSIQGSGGADVNLTDAFSVYGLARLTLPMTDPAGLELRWIAGLRWRR